MKAPLERIYQQWSRIEELPKFIPPLREVRRMDDTHFSYTWHRNGHDQQGVFHIVLQIPGRRIAWRTMCEGFMSGVVSFESLFQEQTEVTLKVRSIFDPPSLSQGVEEYLRNFKQLVEDGEAASARS
ncbi:MAG TPA: SRPBCC family protein [Candidatus Udaeobacter sp.]